MIDISDQDVVAERRTTHGRFLLFTSTDVPPHSLLPYWGVMCDYNGDAGAILVRLHHNSAPNGWTAYELLLVVRQMTAREESKRPGEPVGKVREHVAAAIDAIRRWVGASGDEEIEFLDDDGLYAYGTAADNGEIWLCPEPEDPFAMGVTAEQLLIIVDQLLTDAIKVLPPTTLLADGSRHVRLALAAEAARVTTLVVAAAVPVTTDR